MSHFSVAVFNSFFASVYSWVCPRFRFLPSFLFRFVFYFCHHLPFLLFRRLFHSALFVFLTLSSLLVPCLILSSFIHPFFGSVLSSFRYFPLPLFSWKLSSFVSFVRCLFWTVAFFLLFNPPSPSGVKRPGPEAGHSYPSRVEVTCVGSVPSFLHAFVALVPRSCSSNASFSLSLHHLRCVVRILMVSQNTIDNYTRTPSLVTCATGVKRILGSPIFEVGCEMLREMDQRRHNKRWWRAAVCLNSVHGFLAYFLSPQIERIFCICVV
jgi:hypothetical protein